ncbi:MAG: glutamine--fructose-6-phosphate aminotransferase [Deltaproteobacteria bacterium GWB2_65_81]|nr:MAG: glutamine--fructose-6-phosphate aminotransferase [Deltaproteobacteria bacterium GWA2_65_63]OGP28549.1 MAG: glutamine--fructose-6-phosphate aminotransferase [Deltaproteobacteria bacterium GWB2_65_81]OGP40458.1 MAG: glutamine--fructose-6-phosphate aminotransferase [Deltaproteobacteria bacterium GWC2_66_88]HAM32766.1 glutamine--fructose-6-phosphate transaminase (isomerizing) [Deltaproteobacteria bacterium]
MCGIVGYTGPRSCVEILVDGLRRLEYRGYDSAGVAIQAGGDIAIRKSQGKIARLTDLIARKPVAGTCGIGHTRWATHGRPSDENAHPHRVGRVAVIHNGIVENHRTIKERMIAKGRTFCSETDTEVISHLLDEYVSAGLPLEEAVRKAVAELRGSYAFLAVTDREPGTLVGVRLNCPMVVGMGEGEFFLASDLTAFLSHTRDVLFLEDGEMAIATPAGVRITDFSGKRRERPNQRIDWSPAMAEKGGYRHFMLKEIHEQPRAILDTLAGRMLPESGEVFFETLPLTGEQLSRLKKVTLVACGTSWHAAIVGKFMIEGMARIPVEVDLGSEYRYRDPVVEEGTLCVAISQSGETADTLAGMREAKGKGATTVSICNVVASTIARESDGVIYTHAGPEIGVASTKAFTTQLVALYLMALHLAQARKVLTSGEISLHLIDLAELPRKIEEFLKREPEIAAVARKYKDARDFLYLGRGISYPIALEGALKLKEISYIHAEGYPAGEMKHGPIALIDERMPVLVLCAKGESYEKTFSNLEEARSRGGRLIAVGTEGDDLLREKSEDAIFLPPCGRYARPILEVVPLQLFAYHMAVLNGTDVDQPRNLAKSVTVE